MACLPHDAVAVSSCSHFLLGLLGTAFFSAWVLQKTVSWQYCRGSMQQTVECSDKPRHYGLYSRMVWFSLWGLYPRWQGQYAKRLLIGQFWSCDYDFGGNFNNVKVQARDTSASYAAACTSYIYHSYSTLCKAVLISTKQGQHRWSSLPIIQTLYHTDINAIRDSDANSPHWLTELFHKDCSPIVRISAQSNPRSFSSVPLSSLPKLSTLIICTDINLMLKALR